MKTLSTIGAALAISMAFGTAAQACTVLLPPEVLIEQGYENNRYTSGRSGAGH